MSTFDTFFHDMEQESTLARPSKALWALDLDDKDNEKAILAWLQGELRFLQDEARERLRLMRRNIALYKGIQYETQDVRRDLRDRSGDRSRNVRKIVVNHLFDLTQNRISRLIKFKPAVAILPTNDEHGDKVSAKATEQLLRHIWYLENFEGDLAPEMATVSNIMGESYLFVTWDPDKGDKNPNSPEEGEKIPLLDSNGSQQKDDMGNPIWVDQPVMVGDVCYEVVAPYRVYLQKKDKLRDSEYCFVRKVFTVEEARLRWPDAADKIKASEEAHEFDFETLTDRKLVNEVVVWEFFHRSSKGMPKGRHMVFTMDGILLNEELPYSHGKLPFVRLTDIDIPGHTHGVSFFETVKGVTSTYNNITNLIQKSVVLASHPKWMMPKGAARLEQLGNDITIVQYQGPTPPQLVQSNPVAPVLFKYREDLKEEFQQISGVFGVSRGEPPAGVKAGVALQFLNEQESERANIQILKWNEFVRQVAIMTIAVAGDYYDTTDERMVRVLGKNNEWMTEFFDASNLSKDYDIRIQNSSALPQSKAARTQTILDLSERFPDMLPNERVLDMLDLAQSDKFVDEITVAVRSAEAEDEIIMRGDSTAGVKEWEDHLAHWKVHVKTLQQFSTKEQTPLNIQKRLMDHIKVHEMWMDQKMKTNPALADALAKETLFPLFFKQEVAPPADSAPPAEPGAIGEGLNVPPELPVNPELGGEAQLPIQGEALPLDSAPPGDIPPPVEPTGAI